MFYGISNPTYNLNYKPPQFIPAKHERLLLKVFLLNQLHQILCEIFSRQLKTDNSYFSKEIYEMDTKIIQLLIQSITNTEEYTLEGISYYTHIPFDIIFEAACGIRNQLSMTFWVRLIDLYPSVPATVRQKHARN